MLRKAIVMSAMAAGLAVSALAQTPQPFPRPAAPSTAPARAPERPAPPPSSPGSTAQGAGDLEAPTDATLGFPIYPTAQFIASYDAGRGQRYYIFGATAG